MFEVRKGGEYMAENIADKITEEMEKKGSLEFTLHEESLLNKELKEYTIFYKIVGESRLKLFRNARMELVFVRLNDDWMRQAKVDITEFALPLEVKIAWDNEAADVLSVKKTGQSEYITCQAMQIDN